MDRISNSKLKYIIIILLAQSLLLLMINGGIHISIFNLKPILLDIFLLITIGLSFLSIIMIQEVFKLIQRETGFRIQQVKLTKNEELIKNLRSQKHDFSNHLQTIYGMVQLNKNG
ncbi:MAG: Spo0B domain-containing protein, partial [Bacillota bacterium]